MRWRRRRRRVSGVTPTGAVFSSFADVEATSSSVSVMTGWRCRCTPSIWSVADSPGRRRRAGRCRSTPRGSVVCSTGSIGATRCGRGVRYGRVRVGSSEGIASPRGRSGRCRSDCAVGQGRVPWAASQELPGPRLHGVDRRGLIGPSEHSITAVGRFALRCGRRSAKPLPTERRSPILPELRSRRCVRTWPQPRPMSRMRKSRSPP